MSYLDILLQEGGLLLGVWRAQLGCLLSVQESAVAW